jgi:hypothetical protein
MKLSSFPTFQSISPLEIVLIILFIIYLIFPVPVPDLFLPYIHSNLGMVSIVLITIYLVLYTTPILAVLSLLIAYELFRRSTNQTVLSTPYVSNSVSQNTKDSHMKKMNPSKSVTLEEEMVAQMAPIGVGSSLEYVDSAFKPVADKILGGSLT